MSQRPGRVQEAIRQEIAKILQEEIKDPRLGFLTVTRVELTKDLRYARVFFSVLGEEKDNALALKGLNSARGYIRGRLSDKIELRYMPDIEFKIDRSWQQAQKVQDLLNKIEKERHSNDAGSDSGDKEI